LGGEGDAWSGKGEGGLVQHNVSGDYQEVCGKIESLVPLMLRGVAEEDILIGVGSELVRSGDREVGVASALKTRRWTIDMETGQTREIKMKPTAADMLHGRTRSVARRAPGVGTRALSWCSWRIIRRWSGCSARMGFQQRQRKIVVLASRMIGHENKRTDTWAREEET
jgi:hypothetical protein